MLGLDALHASSSSSSSSFEFFLIFFFENLASVSWSELGLDGLHVASTVVHQKKNKKKCTACGVNCAQILS